VALIVARARLGGLSVETVTHGRCRKIPSVVAENLLRILQEALANASSHAQAQHTQVELRFRSFGLTLRIRDDGRGFQIQSPDTEPGRGLGLTIMRERAQQIGARLKLRTELEWGTEVEVTLRWIVWTT
jgi:two-component system NarL family sensor kinase